MPYLNLLEQISKNVESHPVIAKKAIGAAIATGKVFKHNEDAVTKIYLVLERIL